MKKVLSIQLPAQCPLACAFCRTPEHNQGDPERVLQVVKENIKDFEEIYVTSNGETGFSSIFTQLIDLAKENGLRIAVLCATERSIVPGLCRAEISLNRYTEPLALQAIDKAKRLGIPTVISMVDTEKPIDTKTIAEKYGVDGVLVRSLQKEGRSTHKAGSTRLFKRVGATLGQFPVAAYRELVGLGIQTTCINHQGEFVPLLGGV